jgi:putative tryptophan/tyrosine transport system substrate-binding protein
MRKKILLVALVILYVASMRYAQAQQPKKVPRIGYLSALDPARESTRSEAIRLALRELGYIENIGVE